MKLVIDIGNTNTKIAIFGSGDKIVKTVVEPKFTNSSFINSLIKEYNIDHIIISSVINSYETNKIFDSITNIKTFILLSYKTKINFINKYSTNECGTDRIAAVAGTWYRFPNKNSLIITGGTCITFDFIDNNGIYYGGAISPGLNMRFLSLSEFTAALPLVSADNNYYKLIGENTKECILSGVQIGLRAELLGVIDRYFLQYPQLENIILNGGDANFFNKLIHNSKISAYIKTLPNLTLEGLNAILNLNLNNV